MPEDAGTGAQGAATGPDATVQGQGNGAAQSHGDGAGQPAANTTSAASAGGQSGAASGAQGASGSNGQDAGDLSAEAMLAAAVSAGTGDGEGAASDPLEASKAEVAKWKKLARQNEIQAKTNAEKAQQFDAYQESQLTEQQKLAARAEQAEQRAAAAEGLYRRTLAAATYDLPPSMIDQLGDGTEEEINARAETLAAAINEKAAVLAAAQAQANGGQQQGRPGGFRPVESLRPGGLPASDNKPQDPNAWVRNMLARKKQ
jgi:hypothetical protein